MCLCGIYENFLTHMNYLSVLYRTFGAKVVRFFISGGSAAATNLAVFYVATSVFTIYYIWASILAYGISFFVSFTLQKFWTFRDTSTFQLNTQLVKYLSITLINLVVNTALIYTLVEFAHLPPLVAQILSIMLIAVWSFFAYHFFVFSPPATASVGKKVFS